MANETRRKTVTEAIEPNGRTRWRKTSAAPDFGLYTARRASDSYAWSDKGICFYASDKSQHLACKSERFTEPLLAFSQYATIGATWSMVRAVTPAVWVTDRLTTFAL